MLAKSRPKVSTKFGPRELKKKEKLYGMANIPK